MAAKFNTNSWSLFEYLANKNFPLARRIFHYFYKEEYNFLINNEKDQDKFVSSKFHTFRRSATLKETSNTDLLKGSLQPFADMGNDFIRTFKPYKSAFHAERDAVQVFSGLGNVGKGLVNIVLSPFVFIGNFVSIFFGRSISHGEMAKNTVRSGALALAGFVNGIASLVRGLTQMATWPLMLIRIPLRGLLTLIKGRPVFTENSATVKKLVAESESEIVCNNSTSLTISSMELHRKLMKAEKRGQLTGVNKNDEAVKFDAVINAGNAYKKVDAAHDYISLFKSKSESATIASQDEVKKKILVM